MDEGALPSLKSPALLPTLLALDSRPELSDTDAEAELLVGESEPFVAANDEAAHALGELGGAVSALNLSQRSVGMLACTRAQRSSCAVFAAAFCSSRPPASICAVSFFWHCARTVQAIVSNEPRRGRKEQ